MLVLSRKAKEILLLETPQGQVIEIHVSQIRGETIKLAIQADRNIKILRGELELREVVQ